MAITIETNIDNYVWSSMLPETISVSTDETSLVATLLISGSKVYETTLSAYNGQVVLYSIGDIIEDSLCNRTSVCLSCKLQFWNTNKTKNASVSFISFYSYKRIGVSVLDFFSHQLSTLSPFSIGAKEIMISSVVISSSLADISYTARIYYIDANGENQKYYKNNFSYSRPSITIIEGVNHVHDILYISKTTLSDILDSASISHSEITACAVSRSDGAYHIIYFSPEREVVSFSFLNNFGFWESVSIPCVTTQKTKKEASEGYVGKNYVQYDSDTSSEYELAIAPIPMEYAEYLEELLNSRDVRFGISETPEDLPKILITDNTHEITTDDTGSVNLKLTYKFANQRSLVDVPQKSEIYDESFTQEFN